MRFKFILKKAGKKVYYSLKRKKISGKIYCAYKEKKCSFFDPYFYKDKLLISDRNNKCIREFIIRDDFTLNKTNNIFKKKDINEFEDVNRGSIFEVNKKEYLVFTYQFNGRSIIVKKDLENNFLINEKDVLIDTTLYYEKMSVMNPYIIQHGKELYCLYSAGETYEPDSICMAKILDFDNNIIIKYQFNPIFANNNKYFYRYHKVAFGDLVFYKGYYLLFYIGYRNFVRYIFILRTAEGYRQINPVLFAYRFAGTRVLFVCKLTVIYRVSTYVRGYQTPAA